MPDTSRPPLRAAVMRLACPLLLALPAGVLAAPPPPHDARLDGAWTLVDGEFVDTAGKTVDYATMKLAGQKLLADGHFAFTTTQDGRFYAAGAGTFQAREGHYLETPRMASYALVEGGTYRFSYTVQGDTWILERHEGGKRVEREVWRRLGEGHETGAETSTSAAATPAPASP